jgi:hypothetical protein
LGANSSFVPAARDAKLLICRVSTVAVQRFCNALPLVPARALLGRAVRKIRYFVAVIPTVHPAASHRVAGNSVGNPVGSPRWAGARGPTANPAVSTATTRGCRVAHPRRPGARAAPRRGRIATHGGRTPQQQPARQAGSVSPGATPYSGQTGSGGRENWAHLTRLLLEDGCIGTVAACKLTRIWLDLMAAIPAPHDQPGHRRPRRCQVSLAARDAIS